MKKSEKPVERPAFVRRPAGKALFAPPTPRPIPSDHPAQALFHSTEGEPPPPSSAETASEATSAQNTPTATPTATATVTPIATPTEAKTPDTTVVPLPRAPRAVSDQTQREMPTQAPEAPKKFEYLDATHSSSEQLVYSYMFRQTISQSLRDRHFGPAELMKGTPIRSHVTVRKAIDGLIEKLSIEIVSFVPGSPFGPRYRVYEPRDIMRRRQQAGIVIDPVTKRIVTPTDTPTVTAIDTPTTPTATPTKIVGGTATESVGVTPTEIVGVLNKENKRLGESAFTPSSSSKSDGGGDTDDDDAAVSYLDRIREIYERATGNTWTPGDAQVAMGDKGIPVEVWGIAICYCLDRAPGHKYQRLAYVLEEARAHQESMKGFSEDDLRAILKHSLRTIERARAAGSWEPRAVPESGPDG